MFWNSSACAYSVTMCNKQISEGAAFDFKVFGSSVLITFFFIFFKWKEHVKHDIELTDKVAKGHSF